MNMAQVNFTLSEEEVLQIFTGDRDEALKFLLQRIFNVIMRAESEEQIHAAPYERTNERQDSRNGTRVRELHTRIGTLQLEVPRHRNEPFHTMIFDNYTRSESSLIATMVQMVIAGVSTRKVEKVVTTLCGTSFSKSTVSMLCKKLDKEISEFRNRSLEDVDSPFLMVDATYFKVREDHKVKSKAFLVALAFRRDGKREVVGFGVYDTEDNYSWKNFFESLKSRGLKGVKMIISDAHKSIRHAMSKVFPKVAWQRCQVHLLRNILDDTPTKYKEGLKTELREMFTANDLAMAKKKKQELLDDYESVAPKAMELLEKSFNDAMSVMCLPSSIRVTLRSTNIIERLNRELKRRSDVIGVFPNAESVNRLMGAVTIEYSDSQNTLKRTYSEKFLEKEEEKIDIEIFKIVKEQELRIEAA